jgi:DNA-binding PadR family transcriptional regulator
MAAVLRHALLALVSEKPRSGYDITRMFDQTLSYAWSAKHSQIYPELNRLHEDGLIRIAARGARRRKVYEATARGRREVRRWLMDTPPSRVSRNEPILRTFFLWLLEPAEQRAVLEAERPHHEELLAAYERLATDAEWETPAARSGRMALEFGILHERAWLAWTDWAIAEVRRTRASAGRRSGGRSGERSRSTQPARLVGRRR